MHKGRHYRRYHFEDKMSDVMGRIEQFFANIVDRFDKFIEDNFKF